jgi:hypothetical protein
MTAEFLNLKLAGMRKLILTLFSFILTLSIAAQDKTPGKKMPKWKKGWTTEGMFSFNVGQGGSRNWAAGSERFSLQGAANLNYQVNRNWRKNTWETNFDFSYALVNTNKLGFRKTDDKIDVTSLFRHTITKKDEVVGIGAWFNMRSQFHHAYDHNESPKKRISGLMAPGYFTLGPGFDIRTKKQSWSLFVSPAAARLILFTNRPYSFNYQGGIKPDGSPEIPLSWHYNIDPERKVRFELGGLVSIKYKREIAKNVTYRTRADFFSNYVDDPQNIDVFWNNMFYLNVNKWLMVNYSFDLIYDDDVKLFGPARNKAATQLRSQLGVGFACRIR